MNGDRDGQSAADDPVSDGEGSPPTPWHLWEVGFISLMWNALGAYENTLVLTGNLDSTAHMTEGVGVTGEQVLAYFESLPSWFNAMMGLSSYGSVIGSILLLLRSRWAVWAFAASLLGLAVTTTYQKMSELPEWMSGGTNILIVALIWSIGAFLLIYSVLMRRKFVLR